MIFHKSKLRERDEKRPLSLTEFKEFGESMGCWDSDKRVLSGSVSPEATAYQNYLIDQMQNEIGDRRDLKDHTALPIGEFLRRREAMRAEYDELVPVY